MAVKAWAMKEAMLRRLKPKGKRGLAAAKRLHRTYKTGVFQQIVESARGKGAPPLSLERRQKIAGKAYWNKVKAQG